jgi:hypothetical protein
MVDFIEGEGEAGDVVAGSARKIPPIKLAAGEARHHEPMDGQHVVDVDEERRALLGVELGQIDPLSFERAARWLKRDKEETDKHQERKRTCSSALASSNR